MVKKGFWKKTGCILISASIILTGWTFFGSSVSDAGISDDGELYSFTTGETVGASAYDGNSTIKTIDDTNSCGGKVEDSGFANCSALEMITIEGNVYLEDKAFVNCSSLYSIYLGSATHISTDTFRDCTSLSSITIGSGSYSTFDDAIYYGTTLIYVPPAKQSLVVKSGTTEIAEDAFYGSNVSDLTFETAQSIGDGLFHQQNNWPKFWNSSYKLNIHATDGANSEVEEYFDHFVEQYGATRCYEDWDKAGATTYKITINYQLLDKDGNEISASPIKITSFEVDAGTVPSYSHHSSYANTDGYVYAYVSGPSPAFAAASSNKTYTYVYQTNGETPSSYTVAHKFTLQDSSGKAVKTVTAKEETVATGSKPIYEKPSTYTDGSTTYNYVSGPTPEFDVVPNVLEYEYVYKVNGESGGGGGGGGTTKKYFSVAVYDVFYNSDLTAQIKKITRTTNTYLEGTSYSYEPINYDGYEFFDCEYPSGTVVRDRTATFKYKQKPGYTGGGSSAQAANNLPYASPEAQTTPKYKIIKGAGQIVAQNAGPVQIVCDGPVDKLLYILLEDGKIIDKKNYTIESGSTILTLSKDYIANLPVGDHAIQFQYNDGYAVTGLKITSASGKTTTTVTYKVNSDGSISSGHSKDSTPTTADGFDIRYLLCLAIFLLGAGAILMSRQKKLEAILASQREDY